MKLNLREEFVDGPQPPNHVRQSAFSERAKRHASDATLAGASAVYRRDIVRDMIHTWQVSRIAFLERSLQLVIVDAVTSRIRRASQMIDPAFSGYGVCRAGTDTDVAPFWARAPFQQRVA